MPKLDDITDRTKLIWTSFYRVALGFCALVSAVGISGFWLFSDRHNDERYVRIIQYDADRRNAAQIHSVEDAELARRLTNIETTLKEIGGDVKQLGRRP